MHIFIKECDEGTWGNECLNTCNCLSSTACDHVTGCVCEVGWRGLLCDDDIDECREDPDICGDPMKECFNEEGYYSCVCIEGYTTADNGTCIGL